jgi:hypothetical protein
MQDPDTNPQKYRYLIFKMVPKIHTEEKTASSTNCAGKTGFLSAED